MKISTPATDTTVHNHSAWIDPATGKQIVSRTDPWSHQVEGLSWLYEHPQAMLYWGMGCGKSKTVVDYLVNCRHPLTIILCPLSVIPVWSYQFETHAAGSVRVLSLQKGTVTKRMEIAARAVRIAQAKGEQLVLVMNYESAWRNPMGKFLLGLSRSKLNCVILDESHRVKSPRGRAALFVSKLAEGVKNRICLSGTPLPHSPLDIFSQWRFLDRREFGWNFHKFKMRYAVMGGYEGKQVVAFRNLDEMNKKIYKLAHRVKKEDALDLPEYQDIDRTFELSPAALKSYKDLEKYLVAEVSGGLVTASNAMTKLLRLQQITSGFVRVEGRDDFDELQEVDYGKRDTLRDILEDLPRDEPVVVFCRFTRDVRAVQEVSVELGRTAFELSGHKNMLKEWQDGGAAILAVQIQAGKEGVDMTRAAYAIYYSLGFSLGDYQQSRDRLHRPGQHRNVSYIHILAEGTVDMKVMRALKKKASVVRSVLDDLGEDDKELSNG